MRDDMDAGSVHVVEPTDEEIWEAVALGQALHQSMPSYKKYTYDEEMAFEYGKLLRKVPAGFIRVAKVNDAVRGVVMMRMMQMPYIQMVVASDMGIFVHPEYFGSGIGKKLVQNAEAWALGNKADRVVFGITSGINNALAAEMFKRLGYDEFGTMMKKDW